MQVNKKHEIFEKISFVLFFCKLCVEKCEKVCYNVN